MKPIRHLIAIVFLLCGVTALGSERVYDQNDMVGTYKYEIPEYVLNLHLHTDNTFMVTNTVSDNTYKHFGKWEVKEDLVVLHFDEHEADTLQVHELDKYVMKEMEILDKDSLFWGHHLQDGYEKRVILQRNDISGSSRKRKGKNEVWKDLIEQVVKDVVGCSLIKNYSYLSDGTKLSALVGSGEGLVYRGPFVYRKSSGSNASSSLTLESAAFGGGRLTPDGALLYVTDYLGSVRAVVDGKTGDLYKASEYSAFGDESVVMVRPQGNTPPQPLAAAVLPDGQTLRDGYTGKEAQNEDFGTSYTDFGARQYSPALRRWMTPDPLSEKYYGTSPYAFCNNNPVNFVDPDGRIIGTLSGAVLGGIFGGINAYRKGESIAKGVVSGVVSGTITGAAVDLTVASGGTLGVIFGASVVGGAIGGVAGEIAGNAVVGENTTVLDVVEAGHDGAFAGAVSGTISAGSQVLSTAAKGTVNGLFNGVDDIKSALPNASDEVVSEISERVLQSEQQALKSINKTQFIFEASAETIYFIQDEIEKDDE